MINWYIAAPTWNHITPLEVTLCLQNNLRKRTDITTEKQKFIRVLGLKLKFIRITMTTCTTSNRKRQYWISIFSVAVGARVFARWINGLYYRGFISQTTHLTVSINYDSGLKITLSKNDETAVVLDKKPSDGEVTIGQRVIGYWPNRVKFYPGYISKLCDNGKKYYFIFDNGDERCQDISEIRTF